MTGSKLKNIFRVDPKADTLNSIEQIATLYPYSSIIQQAYLQQLKSSNSNQLVKSIQCKALQINNRSVLKKQLENIDVRNNEFPKKNESSIFSIDELSELPELERAENEKDKAIEAFLNSSKEISPIQPKDSVKAAPPTLESELDLVSETLAQIFVKQGNFNKAKEIYTKLTLKYPEKRDYFAALIKKMK